MPYTSELTNDQLMFSITQELAYLTYRNKHFINDLDKFNESIFNLEMASKELVLRSKRNLLKLDKDYYNK